MLKAMCSWGSPRGTSGMQRGLPGTEGDPAWEAYGATSHSLLSPADVPERKTKQGPCTVRGPER